ncbi:hypothetical protein [Trichormus variabilis]|nr:hypothetical protein [Trichormus variabilis]
MDAEPQEAMARKISSVSLTLPRSFRANYAPDNKTIHLAGN